MTGVLGLCGENALDRLSHDPCSSAKHQQPAPQSTIRSPGGPALAPDDRQLGRSLLALGAYGGEFRVERVPLVLVEVEWQVHRTY